MEKFKTTLQAFLVFVFAFTLFSVNPVAIGEGETTIMAGPNYGYCMKVISYTWTSRVSTSPICQGDDVGQWYTLPWSFPFYGESKLRTYICSNGFLIFDPTDATNDYSDSLTELKARWKIAVFWDDLRTDTAGGIVTTPGVYVDVYSDFVVITWEATRYGASADSIKFQILLYKNGNIQISLDDASNIANFSPTMGLSKATNADFILFTEKVTKKTWFFYYDCGCFHYDRCQVHIWPCINLYPTQYKCLTSSGWVDHGYCYCGPPNSRKYVPDYLYWYLGDTYFLTDLKYTVNLYAAAQSWSGRDFCYTVEYNMPRDHGNVTGWYSNLLNVAWNPPTEESWAGVPTWEWDAHTFTPEQIKTGTIYWVDSYFSMKTGYTPGGSIGPRIRAL